MGLKQLFGCCRTNQNSGRIDIHFASSCCKSKSFQIIIDNEDDLQKILKLLEEMHKTKEPAEILQNSSML